MSDKESIRITGIKEYKPGVISKLTSRFHGFESGVTEGNYIYSGIEGSPSFEHALTNFSSSICNKPNSFHNFIIGFSRSDLLKSLSCLYSAGIKNKIYIHDMTSEGIYENECHSFYQFDDNFFLQRLLFKSKSQRETEFDLDLDIASFLGKHVIDNNGKISDFTEKTLAGVELDVLVRNYSKYNHAKAKENPEIASISTYSAMNLGCINIFLCDPLSKNFKSSRTTLRLLDLFLFEREDYFGKSRLLVSDIAEITKDSEFLDMLKSQDNSLNFDETHLATNQPEHLLIMDSYNEKRFFDRFSINTIYSHANISEDNDLFKCQYIMNEELVEKNASTSKSIYIGDIDNLSFEVV